MIFIMIVAAIISIIVAYFVIKSAVRNAIDESEVGKKAKRENEEAAAKMQPKPVLRPTMPGPDATQGEKK
jgi:hypothetical protein